MTTLDDGPAEVEHANGHATRLPTPRQPADDIPPSATTTLAGDVANIDAPDGPVPASGEDDDYGPILPQWMRSRSAFLSTVRKVRRRVAFKTAFHAVRVPLYTIRWSRWALAGLGRSIRTGWTWAFDLEGRQLRRSTADAGQAAEYVRLRAQHHHRVKLRLWAVLGTALTTAVGLAIAQEVCEVTMPSALLAAMVTFGIVGRAAGGASILDTAVVPLSVELTSTHLNDAFRAAGLLGKDAELVIVQPIMRDAMDIGYTCVLDLPKGGGKKAADVLAARDTLAAELGVDEVQLMLWRIRAGQGGHAARIGLWCADDDPYLAGDKTPSPMVEVERFSVWDPIPIGTNARGARIAVAIMWQSIFIGGLPRRGKSFFQRLIALAAILDPYARVYCADGKGGKDWKAVSRVAHRYVAGAEDSALKAFMGMLAELIGEMERRFALLNTLSDAICPEGKLTPQIAQRYGMHPVFIVIDELQEFLSSLGKDEKEAATEMLCRLARRAPAAGFVLVVASQRPDAISIPTKLREIITYRFSVQCVDKTSSDMVLGAGKASIGADASLLNETHLGVGVLVTGPTNFDTVKADYVDLPTLSVLCERGRALRQGAKTLGGDAAGQLADLADPRTVIPAILTDCLSVMRHAPAMHTTDLLTGLAGVDDGAWGDLNAETLAAALDAAGVVRSTKQVKVGGTNLAGYRRADLEAALPATWTADAEAA